jgi:drug/metabolite transporter superfamily protein YnfA
VRGVPPVLRHAWSLLLGTAVGLLLASLVSFASGGRFGYVYLALGGLFAFTSLGVALLPADGRAPAPAAGRPRDE